MRNRSVCILLYIGLLLTAGLGTLPPTVTAQPADEHCFAATGYCISGRIREFWEQNGGLPVFGYPVTRQTETFIEGQSIQAQWFERNRLELHPENAPPYDVLLGRLGVDALQQQERDWQAFPTAAPQAGCRSFEETRHNVCGNILARWQADGLDLGDPGISAAESLALFGLPLSEVITETLGDGQTYEVQYFERARFELHPENAPPYNVLLGLLGNELIAAGQSAFQPPPLPTAVTAPANPEFLTALGDTLYFAADDGIHGRELWRSDGTPDGTALVRDIVPGSEGSFPIDLTNVNGTLYFGVGDGLQQTLWKSDGTHDGTVLVADGVMASLLFSSALTVMGDQVFFIGSQGDTDEQIWVTDGTSQGTRPLTATPGGILPHYARSRPIEYPQAAMTVVGETLYFHGNTDENPNSYALWRSDGTPEGTQPISTLDDGTFAREYWDLTAMNGTLMFVARTGERAYGLWTSDGTPEGTRQIHSFERPEPPFAEGAFPSVRIMAVLGTRLYLRVAPTTAGPGGLWTSDGTTAGTVLLTEEYPESTAVVHGVLYYVALSDDNETLILRRISDPHSAPQELGRMNVLRGTTRLKPTGITVAAGMLYLALNDSSYRFTDGPLWPAELWRSDGTSEGMALVATVARSWAVTNAPPAASIPAFRTELVEAGGVVYLVGDDGVYGRELWHTDGTADGTSLVYDINEQPAP